MDTRESKSAENRVSKRGLYCIELVVCGIQVIGDEYVARSR